MKACTGCGGEFPESSEFFRWDKRRERFVAACHDCRLARQREATRRYRLAHPGAAHAYYERIKDRHKESMSAWRAGNALSIRVSTARYRARKRAAGGVHTVEDVLDKRRQQAGLCYWCSGKLGPDYEVDHFSPVSKGGSDGPENIVVACKTCNRTKHAKAPEDFIWELVDSNMTGSGAGALCPLP